MSSRQRRRAKVTAMARLRDDHVEATRRALLDAARQRFGTRGFGGTSLDDVAADAGVTKGALYHHFRGKEHLFLSVYDEVESDLSAHSLAAAAQGSDAVDALRRGFGAFLDLALDPAVQRIALLDAASVLGTAAKLEVDARHSLAAVRTALEVGVAEGLLAPLDPATMAALLIAACSQAALLIATADDPATARPAVGAALDRLLTGLTPSGA
jgi:AcrR family transcriptional regulator